MLRGLLLGRQQRLHLYDLLRLQPITLDHAIARGIGLGKEKVRVKVEERHRRIDAVNHVYKHNVFHPKTAGKYDFLWILLDRSHQDFLWLFRLKRLTPSCKFFGREACHYNLFSSIHSGKGMISNCARLSHPPTHWHAETCP